MNMDMFYVLLDMVALSYLVNDLRANKHQGRMKMAVILGIILFSLFTAINMYKVFMQ